jgi:hypothetical protein
MFAKRNFGAKECSLVIEFLPGICQGPGFNLQHIKKLKKKEFYHLCKQKKELLKSMVCIYNGVLLSHTEEWNQVICRKKWVELEIIILHEISQIHEGKYCMFSLIYEPKTDLKIEYGLQGKWKGFGGEGKQNQGKRG